MVQKQEVRFIARRALSTLHSSSEIAEQTASRGEQRRCPSATALLCVGVSAVLLAVSGCGLSRVSTTVLHAPAGATPTVITATSGVRTDRAAPPWRGLPMQTRTAAGVPGDPINIAFEGSRSTLLAAFRAIGWVQADPLSRRDDLRLVRAALTGTRYPRAPISLLYVFSRPQGIGVEHELGSVARRDHVRLWNTGRIDPDTGKTLWIGAASRDVAIEVVVKRGFKHSLPLGTTHRIDPTIDTERDQIVRAMRRLQEVETVLQEPGVGPTSNGRNGENNLYVTDGRVDVVVLKPRPPQ